MTTSHTSTVLKVTRLERAADDGFWLAFRGGDGESFAEAVDAVRRLPRFERTWDPDVRAWWLSAAGMRKLLRDEPDFARAVHEFDDSPPRPRTGRHSSSSSSSHRQQRAHHTQGSSSGRGRTSSAGVVITPQIAEAFATLSLLPSASVDLVRAALRVASRIHHPDVGGDLRTMQRLSAAADTATNWIKQQQQQQQRATA